MLWDEPKIFFLERRYFFSIILSEFLKNRVALHPFCEIKYGKLNKKPSILLFNFFATFYGSVRQEKILTFNFIQYIQTHYNLKIIHNTMMVVKTENASSL